MSTRSIEKESGDRRLTALLILLGMTAVMFLGMYLSMFYMAVQVDLRFA